MSDKIKILYDAVSKDYNVGNFDEFQKKLQDDTKRKAFYDGVGAEYNLGNFDEFSTKVKKKEPTTSGLQSGSPISTKPFDVFQTERNKKSTINVATGEVKPYVEPKKPVKKVEDKSSFLSEIGDVVTSGFGALGSIASSIPSGTLDTYGKMNPTNQGVLGGLGILTDWIKDIKTNPNDNLALQYISKFSNIGKGIKQQPKNNIDAEQLGQLTEKYIGIPEEYNPLSPNNSVTQYFNKVQKENSDKAYKNYDGGILKAIKDGNYKTAGKLATLGAAQSLPIMLGIVASRGAGVGNYQTLAGLGIGTASQEYEKLKEENPNIDKNLLLINAQLTGLGEAGSELVGTSLLYDQAKNLFKKGLKDEAEKVIKSGVKSYIDNMFKKSFIGSATLSDMKGEMVNELWKNAIDKWSGVAPNRDYTDGVIDAGIISLFSSGGTSIGLKAISNVVNPSSKNVLKEKIKELDEINLDIDKENITEGVKTVLQEKGNQLTEEINDIINSENNKLKSLPENKQEKAIELSSNLDAIEKSLQQTDLSDVTKNELEQQKAKIEEELQETLKPQTDAIQEQATGQIPEEISNLGDEEVVTLNVKTLDEVPEQFRERARLSPLSEIETRKKILGLPIGKKETKLIGGGYTYTLTGKEAKDYAIQEQATGKVPIQPETTVSEEVEGGKPEAEVEGVTEKGKEEALKDVETLRAEEQAELNNAIPNAEQYKTDGKIDRAKITDPNDLKAFDEIYDKYDKLISPLLKEGKTEEVKSVEQLTADAKKAKTKVAKTEALQKLKEQATPEQYKTFIDENPTYKKYEVEPTAQEVDEINDSSEVEVTPELKGKYDAKKEQLKKQEEEILKRLRKKLGNLSAGFNPEVIPDLIELGSVYIQRGVITFKEFADKMKADYGSDIPEKNLRDIYNASANKLGLGIRRTPERVATDEGLSPKLREIADETESVYQKQDYKEVQEKLDSMTEAEKNALVGTLANVTGELNAEGNVGVLAAIDLINMYEAKGDKAGAKRVFDIISKSATAFAQLLRQYGQLKSSTSEGYVSIVEKAMKDKFGVELTDKQKADIQDLYEKSKSSIENESKVKDELVEQIESGNGAKEQYKKWGEATVALEDANRALQDYIDALKPKDVETLFGNLTSITQGNLLSLKSLIQNPFANAIQAGVRLAENEVSNLLDYITSVITGQRTKISGLSTTVVGLSSKASLRGLKKAGRMFMKGSTPEELAKIDVRGRLKPTVAWKDFYKGLTGKNKYSFVAAINDLAVGTIGVPANLALRLLPFGDLPVSEQAKTFKLIEIAENELGLKGNDIEAFVLKPDAESLKIAEEYGNKATLQEANKIYSFINKGINMIGESASNPFTKALASAGKYIVRGNIVPFLKTPINYANRAIRFLNPFIPYTQAIYHSYMLANSSIKIKNPLLKAKAIRKHQTLATEYFGEAMVSQAVMSAASVIIGYSLATGDEPEKKEDAKERNFMYATQPPNTLNISGLKRLLMGGSPKWQKEDTAISYYPLGILGAQLGVMANTSAKSAKEELRKRKYITTTGEPYYKEDNNFIMALAPEMTQNIPATLNFTLNQGFAQGVGSLLSAVSEQNYGNWSNQMLKTLVTGLAIPNTVAMSFKSGNDYIYNYYSEDTVEGWANIFKERTGNVKDLPIKYDMWGRPIKETPDGADPYTYHLIDIFRTRKILKDKYTYYTFDLYKKTGDKRAIPSSVSDIIEEESGLYKKLTPKDKSELQRLVGEERYKRVSGIVRPELSLKSYNPSEINEKALEIYINRLSDAYKNGAKEGKRRFKKEILSKQK